MKRIFSIPAQTDVFRVVLPLMVAGPLWAVAVFSWLDHGFYRGDARNWYVLSFLVIVTVLVWWVPRRMRVAALAIEPGGVLRVVSSGTFRNQKRDFEMSGLDAVVLRKRTTYGSTYDYRLAVVSKDGGESEVWTSGYSVPDLVRAAETAREFSEATGIQFRLVSRDLNADEDKELKLPSPAPPARVAAGLAVLLLPWLAGFIAPQVTHSVPILVIVGFIVLGLLGAITLRGAKDRLRAGSSLFLSAVYYLVAASVSFHGLH